MREKEINAIADRLNEGTVAPFWMWNDRLDKDQLVSQLQNIKSKDINQVMIHPRFGLETPYLSDEWFDNFSAVLEEAKRLKMGIWIYDELNWPSGYADGKILAQNPEFQASHIVKTKSGFDVRKTSWKPAYSDTYYTDVLNPKATDAFLENVYEQYWQRFRRYFGGTIQGFFTDEPGLYNNFAGSDPNSLPWSEGLPTFFRERVGYDLETVLPIIWEGNSSKSVEARVDFWEAVSTLYQESYFKRIRDWCHKRGVALIGHVLAEESMVETAKTQGNFFSAMKYLDFAGYDLLSRLDPKTLIPAKLAKSASKLYDLHGVTAETFGIFGWDLTAEEMQRVAKWQIDMGLDVLIPHALYYSLRGQRNDDCPPSFFAEKYWDHFDNFVKYVRKLKSERKEQQPQTAIYYPIESVWGQLLPDDSRGAEKVNWAFQLTSLACFNNDVNFDYVNSEAVLKEGLREYRHLILPQADILPRAVLERILSFTEHGGRVIAIGNNPSVATKTKDQLFMESHYKSMRELFDNIPLPGSFETEQKKRGLKDRVRNTASSKLPPIWIARGIRLAKLLGYKQKPLLRQETGLEESLKIALH